MQKYIIILTFLTLLALGCNETAELEAPERRTDRTENSGQSNGSPDNLTEIPF